MNERDDEYMRNIIHADRAAIAARRTAALSETEIMAALESAHQLMQQAYDALAKLRGRADNLVMMDTTLACGEALGVISKAKALLGRDIDDFRREESPP